MIESYRNIEVTTMERKVRLRLSSKGEVGPRGGRRQKDVLLLSQRDL